MNSEARAFVYVEQATDAYRAGRSVRSLSAAGITATELCSPTAEDMREIFRAGGPVLFLRAGGWLVNSHFFRVPPSSATGKPLCALGATRMPADFDAATEQSWAAWNDLFTKTGGDFSGSPDQIPYPSAVFLDALATRVLAEKGVMSLADVLQFAQAEFRLVHFAPLDVCDDRGLRMMKVITSLQRGGAERVALDVIAELPRLGTRVRLVTLGRAVREVFPAPQNTHELAALSRKARYRELARLAVNFGADIVHGHLLSGTDACAISGSGLPLALTVHNTQPGWPAGLADLATNDAHLLVACARAVESDLQGAKLALPVRTVRNGISIADFQPTPERLAAGREWRKKWEFSEDDFVLVAVANPRPQKRLDRLPAVLATLRARQIQARLVFAGEVLRGNPDAERSLTETQAEISRLGLETHVRWTGPVADVAGVLAATDVLISASAHEGLSLAQLEALAMGRSVVATDVGGAGEIAKDNPRVHLLPSDATPEQFTEILAGLHCARVQQWTDGPAAEPGLDPADSQPPGSTLGDWSASNSETNGRRGLSLDWSRQRMAARYRWLYPRAIAAARRTGKTGAGLWLITNNFSTGGAQASARRLLLGLQSQGERVRAAVIEEDPAFPTPGRRVLLDRGVPVIALSLDAAGRHEAAIEEILTAIDADPPRSVLFWNLRPAFKVALADALLNTPVFDVSPGEMFYDSLEKYFQKPNWRFGCGTSREYGALLAGVIVKYFAESERAAAYLGAPVYVIPNGVPVPEAGAGIARNGNGAEKPAFVFGTAARINPQKRLEDLLEAFRLAHNRLPPYVLKIAGGIERGCNDYANTLRAGANGLPLEWLGEVTEVASFHRGLDAFAMISEPAGCPNASLEAIAAGLPVVATDFGGASEQVIDGVTGRLVPARNPEALAAALVEFATQPDLRLKMSLAGTELVRQRFSLERMIADYQRICLP